MACDLPFPEKQLVKLKLLPEYRKLECPCPGEQCPLNGNCCYCTRFHRYRGREAPYCLLPDVPGRRETRRVALWLYYFAEHPEELEEDIKRMREEGVPEEVISKLERIARLLREA